MVDGQLESKPRGRDLASWLRWSPQSFLESQSSKFSSLCCDEVMQDQRGIAARSAGSEPNLRNELGELESKNTEDTSMSTLGAQLSQLKELMSTQEMRVWVRRV